MQSGRDCHGGEHVMKTQFSAIAEQMETSLLAALDAVIQQLPSLFAALILILLGWFIARLVKTFTIRGVTFLNSFLRRVLTGRTRAVVLFSDGVTSLLGSILYWVTLFIFAVAALKTAGFSGIAVWLERIADYLPAMLAGGLIILLGYVISRVVRDVVLAAALSARFPEAQLISRITQTITFLTALVIGMDQAGVDVSFITTMLGVSTAAVLIGFAIAFGLGAKVLVSNLLAAHYLRELLEPGQRVRVGDHEGTVLDVSATALVLDTLEGRVSIPAKVYHEQAIATLLPEPDRDEP